MMSPEALPSLSKAPTGIKGLDEITAGGLPAGRPTLICGSAGCGKTMLAVEFLVRGATSDIAEVGFVVAEHSLHDRITHQVTDQIFHHRGGVGKANGRTMEKQ